MTFNSVGAPWNLSDLEQKDSHISNNHNPSISLIQQTKRIFEKKFLIPEFFFQDTYILLKYCNKIFIRTKSLFLQTIIFYHWKLKVDILE